MRRGEGEWRGDIPLPSELGGFRKRHSTSVGSRAEQLSKTKRFWCTLYPQSRFGESFLNAVSLSFLSEVKMNRLF